MAGRSSENVAWNTFAESARAGSSKLAQQSFETKAVGAIRMGAVHYCLAAIKHFAPLPKAEVQKITFEISMEGRNGFDVNDPERKHRLKSMPGEFSSLQLVCYMFVGFQSIAPGTDMGFDLTKEYSMAKGMR